MRWSERLWRLRECWRKLGALAGRGVGKRLDYTCDLIMEAWVDQPPMDTWELQRWAQENLARRPSPLFAALDNAIAVDPEDLVKQAGPVAKAPPPSAGEAVLEELRRWWR